MISHGSFIHDPSPQILSHLFFTQGKMLSARFVKSVVPVLKYVAGGVSKQ